MNIIFKKQIIWRSYPNIHYTLIMFGHFKKSASILTDQDTQMVGNDQWPATTCNAALLSFITLLYAKTWAYELNSNFKNKSG